MKIIKKILALTVTFLLAVIIGSAGLRYFEYGGNFGQQVLRSAGEVGDVISLAAEKLSAQAGTAVNRLFHVKDDDKAEGVKGKSSQKPAIPVTARITSAPGYGQEQSQVAAPVSASSLESVWGDTGMQGLTVYEYGKTLLTGREKICYVEIAQAVQKVQPQLIIKTDISPAQIKKVYDYYVYDHAEVFYLDGVGLQYSAFAGNYTYQFTFNYKYNGDSGRILSMRSRLRSKAIRVLDAANGLSTDLKKEKALHDRLIRLCSYDIKAAENTNLDPDSFSAYGAIVDHRAVCQGYAQAMKLLLSSAGIKSIYITGMANGGSHAWNMVEVGGHWKYLDATFDDPVFTDGSGNYVSYNTVSYTYFNFKEKRDHSVGSFDSQNPFSATSENYAVMPRVN